MPQIPNTVAEKIGIGGIVKFSAPYPVTIEKVGTGNIATVDGHSTYTFTEVGEYLFEANAKCRGFYTVTEVGTLVGCCLTFSAPDPDTGEITVTDEYGNIVAVLPTNAGTGVDTDTRYEFTNNADGSFTVQATTKQGVDIGTPFLIPSNDTNTTYVFTNNTDGSTTVQGKDKDGADVGPEYTIPSTANTDTHYVFTQLGNGNLVIQPRDKNGNNIGPAQTISNTNTDQWNTFTTNANGTITAQLRDRNGNNIGTPQVLGTPHTVDTDTRYDFIANPDGTVTIQRRNIQGTAVGTPVILPNPDTNTTYVFSSNPDGSTTVQGQDKAGNTVGPSYLIPNTNTIQTAATFDDTTRVLTQTFTDINGVALPDITTTIPALDVCAVPVRAPDVATMEIVFCDANGLGKMSYADFLAIDSDGDGLPDICEICEGTDRAVTDTDGDGLTDGTEVFTNKTDPTNPDTDGGGVNDGDEVTNGTDPLVMSDDDCATAQNVLFTDVGGTQYFMSDTATTGEAIMDVGGNIIGYEWTNCGNTVEFTDVGSGVTLDLRTA